MDFFFFTDVMDGMSSTDTAFKLFDKDRDGYITRAEFAKVTFLNQLKSVSIFQVSKKMTNEQIDAIFAKFDDNGDGKMSKKEFKQLMLLSKKNPGAGGGVSQSPAGSRAQSPAPSRRQPTVETTE